MAEVPVVRRVDVPEVYRVMRCRFGDLGGRRFRGSRSGVFEIRRVGVRRVVGSRF